MVCNSMSDPHHRRHYRTTPSSPTPPLFDLTRCFFFFFNDTATTEIYTLSLHDALPIPPAAVLQTQPPWSGQRYPPLTRWAACWWRRSEEHTSELQSHLNLVCRLPLEKKKKQSRSNRQQRRRRRGPTKYPTAN